MYLKFKKTREDIKLPRRENPSDAGLDVFWNMSENDDEEVVLNPGDNYLFGIGISIEVPHGYVLLVKNRSGIAVKSRIVKGAEVIDAGYSGEIFIDLHNIGHRAIEFVNGDKIAQLIMVPVVAFQLIESDTIYDSPMVISNRGDTGFGHSGKN